MHKLLFALSAIVVLSSCNKEPHRQFAHQNGRTWNIMDMTVAIVDDGTAVADTSVASGQITFDKNRNRDREGTGTISRFEYDGSAWSAELVEESFIWTSEDDLLTIDYQDGRTEYVQINISEKNSQEWNSTTVELGNDVSRSYILELN